MGFNVVTITSKSGKQYSWTEAEWDFKGDAYTGFPESYKPRDMGGVEIWDFIPNTNKTAKISTFGKVKVLENINGKSVWKILKPTISSKGYASVCIKGYGNYRLPQAMMNTFNPKPNHPLELVIDHVNDNTSDNRLVNLHWVTLSVNQKKSFGRDRNVPPNKRNKVYAAAYDMDWNALDCDTITNLHNKYSGTNAKGNDIVECCKGIRDHYKDKRFKYFSELTDIEKEEIYVIKPEMRNWKGDRVNV